MTVNLQPDLVHIIILDISGIYAQIYDQGFFTKDSIDKIFGEYNDESHWRVVALDQYI